MTDISTAVQKIIGMKDILRRMAVPQMATFATEKEQERGRKLWAASKALEQIADELVQNAEVYAAMEQSMQAVTDAVKKGGEQNE